VENSSAWSWETDGNFTITCSNSRCIEIIGYSPEKILTTKPYQYLAGTEKKRVQTFLEKRAADHASINRFRCITLHKDGREVILETNAVPVLSGKGRLLGYRCVSRDITKQEQAKDQEQLFLKVFKQSEDAVFILKDEHFLDCNQAAVKMLGARDKNTLINTHPAEFSPPCQPDGSLSKEKSEKMIAAALTKSFHRFEWLHRRLDGEDLPCEVTLTKTVLAGETVLHALLHDLTKQKRREHHLHIFQAAMEQSMDGIAMADMDGHLQFANSAWAKMHGYETETKNLIGRSLNIFHTKEQLAQDVEPFNECVRRSGSHSGEVGHVSRDGRQFPTRMSTSLIQSPGGKPLGLVAIAHDITEQKKLAELRKGKEAAELANQTKTEFLANMSHELRTPMHAILSYARFGIQRINKVPKEKLLEYFREIAGSGEQLMLLLNDLLDLAKLESGKMKYVMGLHKILPGIEQVIAEFTATADEKGVDLVINDRDESLVAWFDSDRIGQVLRNLLSNAIKFSKPEKPVHIKVKNDTLQNNGKMQPAVRISIIDQGIGVPEDELESIFDKFVQSSKTRTGTGGTGLGLPICKQIVQEHRGGRIWAELNPCGGMTFHLVLPSQRPL
jgi:PAS domain S-box-containing protein